MLKDKIFVQLKPSVLDPQGKAVTNSLHHLGFDKAVQTRISKYIEIIFDSADNCPNILNQKSKMGEP
ncbi:MAG: phosphoribosylformylglycinamidine synthase subunit PurS [Candidatus Cloacimonadota bacterium]|nr:phosphoribosylformylglycinamidine synthase subunit PurS [Candidatus Cloacimonadota bacterium]